MRKIIKDNRRLWCHKCKKEVLLSPHMWDDICSECSATLKPRMAQDFEEVSDEEYERRMRIVDPD